MNKYERCVLKVKERQPKSCEKNKWQGKGCYNPWAVCTVRVGRPKKVGRPRKSKTKTKRTRKTKSKTKSKRTRKTKSKTKSKRYRKRKSKTKSKRYRK